MSTTAHPVDIHVGKRIRYRRSLIGVTQQVLADRVGIKFQQIQKYETGANRVSSSRLWDIATALDVQVSFFFDGYDEEGAKTKSAVPVSPDDREAMELLRYYYAIPETQRRRLFDLAKALSPL